MSPRKRKPAPALKQKNIHRAVPAAAIGFLVVGILLVASSFMYSWMLRDKVYPGVKVGTRDIGGRTYEAAGQAIASELYDYSNELLTFRQGPDFSQVSLSELGVGFDSSATIEKAKQVGRTSHWIDSLVSPVYAIGGQDIVQPALIKQPDELERFFARLAQSVDRPGQPVRFVERNGQLMTVSGAPGQVLDQETALAETLRQIGQLEPVDVALPFVAEPVLTDAARLDEFRKQAAALVTEPLRLTRDEKTVQIEPAALLAWLTVSRSAPNEDWSLVLERASVRTALAEALKDFNEPVEAMQSYRSSEMSAPVQPGKDGRMVEFDATMDAIEQAWIGRGEHAVPIVIERTARPVEWLEVAAPKPEGKSILVDLTRQTAFAFKDGALQFFALASTGKYPMLTPTGDFHVYNKTRRQVMDGPDFYLPNVQWVMFYSGDYSLHGTYWHNNFGHPMSHGCTNLSNESAERFYNFADIGTPVTILGETPRA